MGDPRRASTCNLSCRGCLACPPFYLSPVCLPHVHTLSASQKPHSQLVLYPQGSSRDSECDIMTLRYACQENLGDVMVHSGCNARAMSLGQPGSAAGGCHPIRSANPPADRTCLNNPNNTPTHRRSTAGHSTVPASSESEAKLARQRPSVPRYPRS